MLFFFTKSKSLKFGFLVKGGFPRDKGGVSSVEDEVISLLPNMPGGNDEDLHEEGVSKLSLTERAAKEQVESRLFNIVIA